MAGGQGGRPPGRRDNPYAPRKRRPPTDEEKKRKDEKSAVTRARTRERKDAAKLAQAAEAAAQKANKRANFFKPQGKKSSQSTKARSSPDARPSDVADAPVAADKGDDIRGEAVEKQGKLYSSLSQPLLKNEKKYYGTFVRSFDNPIFAQNYGNGY